MSVIMWYRRLVGHFTTFWWVFIIAGRVDQSTVTPSSTKCGHSLQISWSCVVPSGLMTLLFARETRCPSLSSQTRQRKFAPCIASMERRLRGVASPSSMMQSFVSGSSWERNVSKWVRKSVEEFSCRIVKARSFITSLGHWVVAAFTSTGKSASRSLQDSRTKFVRLVKLVKQTLESFNSAFGSAPMTLRVLKARIGLLEALASPSRFFNDFKNPFSPLGTPT